MRYTVYLSLLPLPCCVLRLSHGTYILSGIPRLLQPAGQPRRHQDRHRQGAEVDGPRRRDERHRALAHEAVCQEGRRLVRLSVVQLFSDPVGLCGSARVVCLFLCCCEENGKRPSFLYPPHLLMGGEAPRQKFRRHAWRTHVFPKASAAESCFPSPNRTGTL